MKFELGGSEPDGSPEGMLGAEVLLRTAGEFGVEYAFLTMGVDLVAVPEAIAKLEAQGAKCPRPVLSPHEFVSVSLAHGYFVATGRPQLVVVYSFPGLANAHGAIANAFKARVPVLLVSGRTALTEDMRFGRDFFIDWAQESRDLASSIREHVKWDYAINSPGNISSAVGRAYKIAMSPPYGPTYLILPREVASDTANQRLVRPEKFSPAAPVLPEEDVCRRIAASISNSSSPLLIVSRLGRNPAAVKELVAFAEAAALPVVEYPKYYMNFPSSHPLHLGQDPSSKVREADTIIVVECDAPWVPRIAAPRSDAMIIHIDEDPVYQDYPYWGFGVDVAARGDVPATLRRIRSAVESKDSGQKVEDRRTRLSEEHEAMRAAHVERAEKLDRQRPIAKDWVSLQIQRIKSKGTVIVNEYDLNPQLVDFDEPGTFFSETPMGSLGIGLGMAIGLKLGRPESEVVAAVGDGSYIFENPVASHWVAARYSLPFLTVIFDDGTYSSVKWELQSHFPDGWATRTGKFRGLDLEHRIDFTKYVEAVGGVGFRVEDPETLQEVLGRAMGVMRSGKQAVVDVICGTS